MYQKKLKYKYEKNITSKDKKKNSYGELAKRKQEEKYKDIPFKTKAKEELWFNDTSPFKKKHLRANAATIENLRLFFGQYLNGS